MDNTFLDQIIDYPQKSLRLIGTDPMVVKLLTDNPNIDLDSDEADEVFDKYLFDYDYVDEIQQDANAYICVEAESDNIQTNTIRDMRLYVTIFCHKQFMKLDHEKFQGISGNRRDNLVRFADHVLNGKNIFGIGQLTLMSVRTVSAPKEYTARELIYIVPDFRASRI